MKLRIIIGGEARPSVFVGRITEVLPCVVKTSSAWSFEATGNS